MPQTSLADRIARLNLSDGTNASTSNANGGSSSSSTNPNVGNTRGPKSTGAVGKISDKISRFQANAEDAPLVPVGSFGLGGVRREPSSSGTSGAGSASDKRVASLGLGRAAVPLASVKATRSVSQGGSPVNTSSRATFNPVTTSIPPSTAIPTLNTAEMDSKSDDAASSSAGTPTSSRASSQYGGASMATEAKSTSSGGSDMPPSVRGLFARQDSSLSVAGSETTAAGSESSLNVETGSLTSEAGPDPKSINLVDTITEVNSPLSSPVLSALVNPVEITVDSPSTSPVLSHTPNMSRSSSKPLKGPLDALKTPQRSRSSVSVSSMLVETGSTTSDDGVDAQGSTNGGEPTTPKAEEEPKPFPTTVGPTHNEEEDEETSGMATPGQSELDDEARQKATEAELAKYEGETFDAVAPRYQDDDEEEERPKTHSNVADSDRLSTADGGSSTPLRSPAATSDAGYGDMLDDYGASTPEQASPPVSPMPGGMPKVKCSDCGTEVEMMDLIDHVCSPNSSPQIPQAHSPSRAFPPAPKMAPAPAGRAPTSPSTSSARDRIMNTTTSPKMRSSPTTSPTRSRMTPDIFVPQTENLVPDDILDAYDDEDDDMMNSHVAAVSRMAGGADLPDDVHSYDDGLDSPIDSMPPPVARTSVDLPHDVDDEYTELSDSIATLSPSQSLTRDSTVRARRGSPKSVYDMAGHDIYSSDQDEDREEGGSVTIVSVTHASHSPSMSRSNSEHRP